MTKRAAGTASIPATVGVTAAPTPNDSAHPSTQLDPAEMQSVVKRLKRAQGQLGGIVKMIEDGRECQDIVMQLSAVSKAVDRAGFAVIALGLRQCITDPTSEQVDVKAMEKLFLSLA
jgi:DNA-binding FrmR family transcriptional regulator